MKAYLKDSVKLQKELFTLSETAVEIKELEDESTADSMFRVVDGNFQTMLPFIEETVDKWNSRTQTVKGAGQSKSINEQV